MQIKHSIALPAAGLLTGAFMGTAFGASVVTAGMISAKYLNAN